MKLFNSTGSSDDYDSVSITSSSSYEDSIIQISATNPNDPFVTSISAGTWIFNIYACLPVSSGNGPSYAKIEVFTCNVIDGEPSNTFQFSTATPIITDTTTIPALYVVTYQAPQINCALTDRIVVKVSGVTASTIPVTVQMAYNGTGYPSSVVTPICSRPLGITGTTGTTGTTGLTGTSGSPGDSRHQRVNWIFRHNRCNRHYRYDRHFWFNGTWVYRHKWSYGIKWQDRSNG